MTALRMALIVSGLLTPFCLRCEVNCSSGLPWRRPSEETGASEASVGKARGLVERIDSALENGDLARAYDSALALAVDLGRIASALEPSRGRRSKEEAARKDPFRRLHIPGWLSFYVLAEGDCAGARKLALEALGTSLDSSEPAIESRYYAHHTLGLIAIMENDIRAAKGHLLASIPSRELGPPTMGSLGLNLLLVSKLLEAGEHTSAERFLVDCEKVWPERMRERLRVWASTVRVNGQANIDRLFLELLP